MGKMQSCERNRTDYWDMVQSGWVREAKGRSDQLALRQSFKNIQGKFEIMHAVSRIISSAGGT